MTSKRESEIRALIAERARIRGGRPTLEDVCAACGERVGADGVTVFLESREAREQPVCTTGPLGRALADLQATLGQGPSVTVLSTGDPVLVADLAQRHRHAEWPLFTPAALQEGARAVFAFPLRTGAVNLGAIELQRADPLPLGDRELADALTFAEAALALMLDDTVPLLDDSSSGEGLDLFSHHVEVHQAAGMISAQIDADIEVAFVRLRAYAFRHERRLTDVAHDVVRRKLRFSPEPQDD
ncbi:GAF and ANTAR domain-containing protein [Nocardiopsis sediminis]|uniref:GAF and ANTAR domain-containing protein n=1 Tax=Nocardiopsis sediminis TaxID=1778267 RepID=A0ABV8FPV9_9ACTN